MELFYYKNMAECVDQEFNNCKFIGCSWEKMSHVLFVNCLFEGCIMSEIEITRCGFKNCVLRNCELMGSQISICIWHECEIIDCSWSMSVLDTCRVEHIYGISGMYDTKISGVVGISLRHIDSDILGRITYDFMSGYVWSKTLSGSAEIVRRKAKLGEIKHQDEWIKVLDKLVR